MEARGHLRTAPPYARFRCLICRVFVVGTASGHCPTCGFVPPTLPTVAGAPRPGLDRIVLLVVAALGLVAALAWGP